MATYTENYRLKKPAAEDFADIADLNANSDKIDAALKKKADLDDTGKLKADQFPDLSFIPVSQKGAADGVASLGSDGKVPVAQLPTLDYIPISQKGAAGGVATLGDDGKIPESQIGTVSLLPQIIATIPEGSTVTCVCGNESLNATSTGAVIFNLPEYGTWTLTATKDGKTATESVVVDSVKQYEIYLSFFSATLNVTSESGATVTATNGTKTFTGIVPSSGTLALAINMPGTYTVSAAKSGKISLSVDIDTSDSSQSYSVECPLYYETLEFNTWAQIDAVSATGRASEIWSTGDEKNVTLGSTILTLIIVGFNHDDLTGGGKAGITFGLKNLMPETHAIDDTSGSTSNYTESSMHSFLNDTVINGLESDLLNVIKPVDKITSNIFDSTGATPDLNTVSMKAFLFSVIEVFGDIYSSFPGEGTQYSYFATAESRVKRLNNGTGSASDWGLRSPASMTPFYCIVTSTGSCSAKESTTPCGVCFGVCV